MSITNLELSLSLTTVVRHELERLILAGARASDLLYQHAMESPERLHQMLERPAIPEARANGAAAKPKEKME
ncbi:MAG: hypothetical protein ABIQ72_18560 [Usitatibacter sp.]